MKALILAAGMGVRLGKLTDERPKALVKVGDEYLIDRVIDFVSSPKIDQIGVVGGYRFEMLEKHLSGRDITLFNNKNYKEGNLLTLKAAMEFITDDLLICNVDHIYPKDLLDHIIRNAKGISAMCDFDRDLQQDDMKVKSDGKGKLIKISKQLSDFDGGYIGMTFCSKELNETYKKAIEEASQIYGDRACVECVLGHMAANDIDINICDTSGFRWLEVDTPDELKFAEGKLKGHA